MPDLTLEGPITLEPSAALGELVGEGVGVECRIVAMQSDSEIMLGAPNNTRAEIIDKPSEASLAQVYNGPDPPVDGFDPTAAPTAIPTPTPSAYPSAQAARTCRLPRRRLRRPPRLL